MAFMYPLKKKGGGKMQKGKQFTDKDIKSWKPTEKEYWKREGQGFGIRVLPSGGKIWYYVYTFEGRKRYMRLGDGSYPDVSLKEARRLYSIARVKVSNGMDPLAEKQQEKEERRKAPTVADLIEEYIEKHAKPNKKTWEEDQRCLEKEVLPLWGQRKAADIKKRDVVLLLEGIVERGASVMANNTFEKVRKMFNFAVERDILPFTPCYGVKKPTKKENKDRVLSDNEIVTAWNALDSAAMSDEIKRALKLILVTAQRPGEVIGMHSSEIEGDWWTVPIERAKNGRTHRVFLTATAKALIGNKEGYIFESPRMRTLPSGEEVSQPMNVNAVAYAVRRNFEESTGEGKGVAKSTVLNRDGHADKKTVMESWTPHDLRRTAATNLSALAYSDEVIDAVLNHVKKGVIAIYNRHRYDREKQAALEAWERKLTSIVSGKQSGTVIPIHVGGKR